MKKMQAMVAALLGMGIPGEAVRAFANQGYLTPQGTDLGLGIQVGVFRYDAVVDIENYAYSGANILAWLSAWLDENDQAREYQGVADPKINVSLNDDTTCNVEISVEFEEGLQIVPDENGPIPYRGQRWKVADVPIDVAEELLSLKGRLHVE